MPQKKEQHKRRMGEELKKEKEKNPPTVPLKNPELEVSPSARRKAGGLCLRTHRDVFKFYKKEVPLNGGA